MFSRKSVFAIVLCLVFVQTALADIFSQLQFIKIVSPKNGDSINLREPFVVKYVMQPLIKDHVSAGRALKLNVNFHKREKDVKKEKLATIHKSCPVAAKDDKYVTYTKRWAFPKGTTPGSYAVDFVELVGLHRGRITVTETIQVNAVE